MTAPTAAFSSSSDAAHAEQTGWQQQWQSRVASFLMAAGLALALLMGGSSPAYASVFPLVETPVNPATLEMKVGNTCVTTLS